MIGVRVFRVPVEPPAAHRPGAPPRDGRSAVPVAGAAGADAAAPALPSVAVQGLWARYPRGPAVLRGVDLEAGPGLHLVLGPTGAGKTTLLRVLAGQLPPAAGTCVVDGRDAAADPLGVRARVGYAPQEVGLPHELTLREYLSELLALDGLPPAARGPRVVAAARAVHLDAALDRRLRRLSGGMRRRALLAQALLGQPRVLLADEPTAGLDPVERLAVQALLRSLARRACVFVATHFLADAEALPGQVLVLHAGRALWRSSTAEFRRAAEGRVCLAPRTCLPPGETGRALPTGAAGIVRLVTLGALPEGAPPVPPTLEDAYFLALLAAGRGAAAGSAGPAPGGGTR